MMGIEPMHDPLITGEILYPLSDGKIAYSQSVLSLYTCLASPQLVMLDINFFENLYHKIVRLKNAHAKNIPETEK